MQRIIDQLYGCRMRDVIYLMDKDKTTKKAIKKRTYYRQGDGLDAQFIRIVENCDELLTITSTYTARTFIRNGKGLYLYNNIHTYIPPAIIVPSPIPTPLLTINNKWYPIFHLLCGNITTLDDFKKITKKKCTPIGANISSSLIKVASTRIFTKPEQCIVELLVNSVDSYAVKDGFPKVGKFGMGFFSVLYFLVDHPLRTLTIVTIENHKAVLLRICYSTEKRNLFFNINYTTTDSDSGTYVYMDASKDQFNEHQITTFKSFCLYTSYIKNANIYMNMDVISLNNRVDNKIVSNISLHSIMIEDYATGISIENVLTSLLVPSTSTKTMKLSATVAPYVNYSDITMSAPMTLAHFIIVSNNIVIVKVRIGGRYNVVMSLPSNISLPVSRDDVIFNEKDVKDSFSRLIERSLEENQIVSLENAIDEYLRYTSSHINKEIFSRCKTEMYNELKTKGIVFVLQKNYDLLQGILPQKKLIQSKKCDSIEIEHALDSLKTLVYRQDIFTNKRVVIAQTPTTTTANTYKYIFVNPITVKSPNWIENTIICFTEERLFMYSSVPSTESEMIERILTFFGSKFTSIEKDMIRSLLCVFLSLQNSLIIDQKEKSCKEIVYGVYFIKFIDPSFVNEYVDMAANYFSSIVINYNYGDTRLHLTYNTCFLYSFTKIDYDTFEKMVEEEPKKKRIIGNVREKLREYVVNRFELLKDKNEIGYYNFSSGILNPFIQFYYMNPFFGDLLSLPNVSIFKIIFLERTLTNWHTFVKTKPSPSIEQVTYIYDKYIKDIEDYKLVSCAYWETNTILKYAINALCMISTVKPQKLAEINFNMEFLPQFTFKQLLTFVFENTTIDQIDPSKVGKNRKTEKLQLLEIAVDAGTNKPFLQATLTELLQNSIDAYRLDPEKDQTKKSTIMIRVDEITDKPVMPGVMANKLLSFIKENKLIGLDLKEQNRLYKEFQKTKEFEAFSNRLDKEIEQYNIKKEKYQEDLKKYKEELKKRKTEGKDIEKQLLVTVTDFIGMTSNNITALSIPFYSNKTSSAVVTGEMGTGFFNIYRESSFVMVNTLKNGKRTIMKDRPVRDDTKHIVDLEKNWTYKDDKKSLKNQTDISFVIDHTRTVVSDIYYYATNVLCYMDIDLYVNDTKIVAEKELLYKEDQLTCYLTTNPIISFIFTKGVPFFPLLEYIKQNPTIFTGLSDECIYEISSKIIIDMGHGFYLPTQSRTALQLSEENKVKLNEFLKRVVFYVSIKNFYKMLINNTYDASYQVSRNKYLKNTGQTTAFSGVLFNMAKLPKIEDKLEDILLYTKLKGLNVTMAEILYSIYLNIMKDKQYARPSIVKKIKIYFSTLKLQMTENQTLFGEYIYIITRWLQTKNVSIDKKRTTPKKKTKASKAKGKNDVDSDSESDAEFDGSEEKSPNVTKSLDEQEMVTRIRKTKIDADVYFSKKIRLIFSTFIDLFIEGDKPFYPPGLTSKIKILKVKTHVAQYVKHLTLIEINIDKINFNDADHFMKNINNYIKNLGNIREDKFYDFWFGITNPASIIAHELEHARRNTDHLLGSHDSVTYEGQVMTFDKVANHVLLTKNQNGLLLKWLQQLKVIFKL
jgi:hypothetical protein